MIGVLGGLLLGTLLAAVAREYVFAMVVVVVLVFIEVCLRHVFFFFLWDLFNRWDAIRSFFVCVFLVWSCFSGCFASFTHSFQCFRRKTKMEIELCVELCNRLLYPARAFAHSFVVIWEKRADRHSLARCCLSQLKWTLWKIYLMVFLHIYLFFIFWKDELPWFEFSFDFYTFMDLMLTLSVLQLQSRKHFSKLVFDI